MPNVLISDMIYFILISYSQDVFPVEFGPKYDAAIEKLMCQFLSRLEKLLPVSNFQQVLKLE